MDETGHVTYIGRKSDCVRFKHYSDTVYPSKILSVVESHEKVQTAKVKYSLNFYFDIRSLKSIYEAGKFRNNDMIIKWTYE